MELHVSTLLLALLGAVAACSTTPSATDPAPAPSGDDGRGSGDDGTDAGPPKGKTDGGHDGNVPAPGDDGGPTVTVPVGTSTRIVPTLSNFVVTETDLFFSYADVQRAALDGSSPMKVAGITGGGALAVDGTRLYVANASGLVAMPLAGGATTTVASTIPASTYAIAVLGTDAYFSWGEDSPPHGISRVAAGGTNGTPVTVASLNPRGVTPVSAGGRVFALDYGEAVGLGSTRDGGLWALDPAGATHLTHHSFGAIFSEGSLAAYSGDVYVREAAGLVRYAGTAAAGATGLTIVPKSDCDISGYDVSSTVAVDASGIYLACQTKGDYEIRKYSTAGVLEKILGTSPNSGYGFVKGIRLTSTHAYWLGRVNDWALYRAPK